MKVLIGVFGFLAVTALVSNFRAPIQITERTPANQQFQNCGMHPFERVNDFRSGNQVFKNVAFTKHSLILHNHFEKNGEYFVNGSHFSIASPNHLFSAMITLKLEKSEYDAVVYAMKEFRNHEELGRDLPGFFAPLLVLSRKPMPREGGANSNAEMGFCMKDLVRILNGEKQALYGGENVLYANLRKWRSSRPIFAPFDLREETQDKEGNPIVIEHSPVITINLAENIQPTGPLNSGVFGDAQVFLYQEDRPEARHFQDGDKIQEYWLLGQDDPAR